MVRPDFLDHGISAIAGMNGMDTEASAVDHPDPTIIDFVENSGLVPPGKYTRFERLPGGVSSDIWLVHADDRSFCVKRALAQLRVAADWRAPIAESGAPHAPATRAAKICGAGGTRESGAMSQSRNAAISVLSD